MGTTGDKTPSCVVIGDNGQLGIYNPATERRIVYAYDKVFDENINQEAVRGCPSGLLTPGAGLAGTAPHQLRRRQQRAVSREHAVSPLHPRPSGCASSGARPCAFCVPRSALLAAHAPQQ